MSHATTDNRLITQQVQIRTGSVKLNGDLSLPAKATGIVIFAHGSGSSRNSPRNQFVARTLNDFGFATLLFDLLTTNEEAVDRQTDHLRFNIPLLAERLIDATYWTKVQLDHLDVGYFGTSTGGAAALVAAAELGHLVGAVVSRGGRSDLAADALPRVTAPTLLVVGASDHTVVEQNESAYARLRCEKELKLVAGATHLFEEPGTLTEVATSAAQWFERHLIAK